MSMNCDTACNQNYTGSTDFIAAHLFPPKYKIYENSCVYILNTHNQICFVWMPLANASALVLIVNMHIF